MKKRPTMKDCKLDAKSEKLYFGSQIYGKEKVTEARIRVLSALSSIDKPISIKKLAPLITEHNTSTIYRTLETLVGIGLVKEVSINSGESLYETTIGRHHHHHIICTSCGHLEDIDTCISTPDKKHITAKGFSQITDHTLEFFGICISCSHSDKNLITKRKSKSL